MFADHVNISQAFVQGELLPGDDHKGKVYISSLLRYDEDPLYEYRLLKPLYSMSSAARAWHTTMSAFLAKKGFATVGFEKSMWTVRIDGARILLGAHIIDVVITCANQQVLDGFHARLLDAFEGTYEGALQHYLSVRYHTRWTKLRICPRPTTPRKFYALAISGIPLLI